jgi:hypothetical protein
MTQTVETKLKIESWDEQPTSEFADGTKISKADVILNGEGVVTAGRSQSLLFYRADGTSAFVVLMRVEATLDGHSGAFVLSGTGRYDGTTARQELAIVDGSDLMVFAVSAVPRSANPRTRTTRTCHSVSTTTWGEQV